MADKVGETNDRRRNSGKYRQKSLQVKFLPSFRLRCQFGEWFIGLGWI